MQVLHFLSISLLLTLTLATHPSMPKRRSRVCKSQPPLICVLSPTIGNKVHGTVLFTPAYRNNRCQVRIRARLAGLESPLHGFHVHTYGDISNRTGSSTGGHFLNPAGTPVEHGLPRDRVRHWGDFGNLRADHRGVATYARVDKVISLKGILGRGVTVHAAWDQGEVEQPTGGSGARVAFCVIGFANPVSLSA